MLKRKIFILILSIITSISLFMGATTLAFASEVNSVSTILYRKKLHTSLYIGFDIIFKEERRGTECLISMH